VLELKTCLVTIKYTFEILSCNLISMGEIEKQIRDISMQISAVGALLVKAEWSSEERDLYGDKAQLRNEEALLMKEEYQLRYEKLFLLESNIKKRRLIPSLPSFDPSKYSVKFPFFEPNGEAFLTLLGRANVITKINDIIDRHCGPLATSQKLFPIVICTSRGMGKTFLLKMIGLQRVPQQSPLVLEASRVGRIISFDFVSQCVAVQSVPDILSFFTRLLIFFLCDLFSGSQVDGIAFERISQFTTVAEFEGGSEFNEWKRLSLRLTAPLMIAEYIRLTNIAFGSSPPLR